jgi:RNA polymerase sigma-70 factor (ECF subfamily)
MRGSPAAHRKEEPDPSLLRRARAGETRALAELLEPFRDSVFRLAYHVTGHAEDAEDLAQDALIRIAQRLHTYRGDCAFRTWAYRVALNVCLTARSRRRPGATETALDRLPGHDPGPEARALDQELDERVRREIQSLPARYREAVLLRITRDLSYEEVAEVLGLPFNTARTRIYRGIERLRKRVEPWLGEGEE